MNWEYITESLKRERRQCSFTVIEGQGYLDKCDLDEETRAILQNIMDAAYERTKIINHTLKQIINE